MKVGDKIWIEPISRRLRRSNPEVRECTISKVGRKYIYVKELSYSRFFKEGLLEDPGGYNSKYQAYLTLQDYKDKVEKEDLYSSIRKHFKAYSPSLTLEQLRSIDKIINQ